MSTGRDAALVAALQDRMGKSWSARWRPSRASAVPSWLHYNDLGEAVLDAVLAAAHVEHVGHVSRGRAVGVARGEAELDAVVGQHGVDACRARPRPGLARKADAVTRVALSTSWTKANLLVRSMATNR